MKAVVFTSGGLMSWEAGRRTVAKYGADNTTFLFTDTKIESPGLYAFLRASMKQTNARFERIADGRTPFDVFNDEGMMGNSRADLCSRILKRELAERWLKANCDPTDTALIFGLGWSEVHRFDDGSGRGVRPRYAKLGWPNVEAPLLSKPFWTKDELITRAIEAGLPVSEAYADGFEHDNCGGGCVRAGKAHWAHLLRVRPRVYAEWERQEDAFNDQRPGKKRQTILRDEYPDRPATPLSLHDFRLRIESGQARQGDLLDWGNSCGGCFAAQDAA
jgi:3'-phosphoadenosine 5'-phosphosulfate sulfotransferase (PAPS reductase)/FAD synthetase